MTLTKSEIHSVSDIICREIVIDELLRLGVHGARKLAADYPGKFQVEEAIRADVRRWLEMRGGK